MVVRPLKTRSAMRDKIALWEGRGEPETKDATNGAPKVPAVPPPTLNIRKKHSYDSTCSSSSGSPSPVCGGYPTLPLVPTGWEDEVDYSYRRRVAEPRATQNVLTAKLSSDGSTVSSSDCSSYFSNSQLSSPSPEPAIVVPTQGGICAPERAVVSRESPPRGGYPSITPPPRNEAVSNYWKQQTLKLEVELKEDRINSLTRELNDLNFTGKAEEEVALLKKAKHDLELRVKDQEEELDDLAGQVQLLEQCKTRLEMANENSRKEMRKESQQREEEVEEIRIASQKKIKLLESQVESEHDERTQLIRDKHELERRLMEAQDRSSVSTNYDEDTVHRLKKDLKKTKALLRDTQTMLDKTTTEGSGNSKLILRQLKTQLEDAEFGKIAAIKARQNCESEYSELQLQLDESLRSKKDAEEKCARVLKERSDISTQLEESEEEVAEVMKKYKATVAQLSVNQISISEQTHFISELEHDKQVLHDRLLELSSKVEVLEGESANIHTQRRLQMKIKELESKLELESTTKMRLESQIGRLKEQMERIIAECEASKSKEIQAIDANKRINRVLRESKEEQSNSQLRLTEAQGRKSEIEKQLEITQSEVASLKADLRLAFKRIEDLQQALQGDISTDEDSDLSDSHEAAMMQNPTLQYVVNHGRMFSKLDVGGRSEGSEGMSVISEDIEDDYRESFA